MFVRAFPEGNSQMQVSGAMVYINKEPIGRTPLTCHFTHYGTMEFTVVKEGYETATEYRKIRAPWYQFPGIDFFSEVLFPQEITDTKQIDFQLKPARTITQDELVERAEGMRREAQANATFRVNHGNAVGTINPITSPPTQNGNYDADAFLIHSNPYSTDGYLGTTENYLQNSGSVGVPSSPFANASSHVTPPSYQQDNSLLPPPSNPYSNL
ncbi:MAG: PEGA domain-containing protein [Planctomycetaceae bacterium]|nr:PEGA domain-containing protein [Planctomycetaceae bacterium]